MVSTNVKRSELSLILGLLMGGLALRLVWLHGISGSVDGYFGSAEASRVAFAVSTGRGIADAYYAGYGPTAHLLPISPAIAGGIMYPFGPQSPTTNVLLLAWCLAQVGLAYVLLRTLFMRLGASERVLTWGLALLCLIPPFISQEVIDFRYWEGATALCLGTLNLIIISRLDIDEARLRLPTMVMIAGLFAVTAFVCPPVGLATGACWAIWALRRLKLMQCMQLATMTAVALALVITPWAIRNDQAIGAPVPLRSNFGLEFALANHPGALSDKAPEWIFADRLAELHPFESDATSRRLVQPGGEVAYFERLQRETWAWIGANPGAFARLYLQHVSDFLFPNAWQMMFTGWEGLSEARANAISINNALGLIGLLIGLFQRRRGYWMLAVYLAAISLPYGLFVPTARYVYLIYGVLTFLAVEGLITMSAMARAPARFSQLRHICRVLPVPQRNSSVRNGSKAGAAGMGRKRTLARRHPRCVVSYRTSKTSNAKYQQ